MRMSYFDESLRILTEFALEHGAQLLWIIGIVLVARFALFVVVKQVTSLVHNGDAKRISGREKRARTLADLLNTTGNVVIVLVAIVMLLRLVGVDPLPILAGASVLGFGIGFGAQTLIKDLFAGIFIFTENQFAVGDRVKIGLMEGTVYKMSMRTTVITDADGNLVFIPNGTITTVVNYSLSVTKKNRFGDKGVS